MFLIYSTVDGRWLYNHGISLNKKKKLPTQRDIASLASMLLILYQLFNQTYKDDNANIGVSWDFIIKFPFKARHLVKAVYLIRNT